MMPSRKEIKMLKLNALRLCVKQNISTFLNWTPG